MDQLDFLLTVPTEMVEKHLQGAHDQRTHSPARHGWSSAAQKGLVPKDQQASHLHRSYATTLHPKDPRWDDLEVVRFNPVKDGPLLATQSTLSTRQKKRSKEFMTGEIDQKTKPARVWREGGRYWLVDGHHRVATAIEHGEDVFVTIMDAKDVRVEKHGSHDQKAHGRRLGGGMWGASHDNSFEMAGQSAKIMGLEGWRAASDQPDHARAAQGMLAAIRDALPVDFPLLHGERMKQERLAEFTPGALVKLPLTATAPSDPDGYSDAESYAQESRSETSPRVSVMFEFEAGTRARRYTDMEYLTAGTFRVVSVSRKLFDYQPFDYGLQRYVQTHYQKIVLQQVEVFDPDASPIAKHGSHDQKTHGARGSARALGNRAQRHGGFTVDPRSSSYPKTGYVVAMPGNSTIIDKATWDKDPSSHLAAYIATHRDKFTDPTVHLGGWHDRKHGEIVLDLVQVVPSRSRAIQLGQDRDEQAIWHLDTSSEINTGGTGGRDDLAKHAQPDCQGEGPVDPAPGYLGLDDFGRAGTVVDGDGSVDRGYGKFRDLVHKHLPGQHDQKTHAGSSARVTSDATPKQLSSASSYFLDNNITDTAVETQLATLFDYAEKAATQYGMPWYRDAHNFAAKLALQHSIADIQAAGVIAALSPKNLWPRNQIDANKLIELHNANPTVTITAEKVKIVLEADRTSGQAVRRANPLDATAYIGTHKFSDLPPSIASAFTKGVPHMRETATKAIAILRGAHPRDALGGNKVRSFYNNIANPGGQSVTIDTHMVRAMMGDISLSDAVYGKHLRGPARYRWWGDRVRNVAKRKGVRPNQVQATVWEQWRLMHTKGSRRAALDEKFGPGGRTPRRTPTGRD